MSQRNKPPFRADHVGSLLRPQAVLEACRQFENTLISADQFRRIEDEAVRRIVKRQEEIGLPCVTDGELRRGSWHMDFLCRIGGVVSAGTQARPFRNESGDVKNEILVPKVVDRLHLDHAIYGEDFTFLESITTAVAKLSIPAPSILDGLGALSEGRGIYQDRTSCR